MQTKVTVQYYDTSIEDMCSASFSSTNAMDARTKALDFANGKKFVSITISHND